MRVIRQCIVKARYEGQTAVLPIVFMREGERMIFVPGLKNYNLIGDPFSI